jgi:hypothetical protein
MSTFKNINNPEFAEEVSTRFVKVVITTTLLLNGFQLIEISGHGGEQDGLYLLYKDIVIAEDSFWFGYKIVNKLEKKIEIDKPIWIHFKKLNSGGTSTISVKSITPLISFAGVPSHSEIELTNISQNQTNIDLIKRAIYNVSKNIIELYAKSRSTSYIRAITNFVSFDYKLNDTNFDTSDFNEHLKIRTRYTPIIIKSLNGTVEAVCVFLESIKTEKGGFGFWFCAPIVDGKIQSESGFLACAFTKHTLNINTILSDEIKPSFYKYEFINVEHFIEKDFSELSGLKDWLITNLKNQDHITVDMDDLIKKLFVKLQKNRDLFLYSVVENINFKLLDHSTIPSVSIISGINEEYKLNSIGFPTDTKNEELASKNSFSNTEKMLNSRKGLILDEENLINRFIDGFVYNQFDTKLVFSSPNISSEIHIFIDNIINHPNDVYNELINFRVDPFLVIDMFNEFGIKFKEYNYADLKRNLELATDYEVNLFVGFENYFVAAISEQSKRKNRKLKHSNVD